VEGGAEKLEPILTELINQAAQFDVIHNDDTTMKVLELTQEQVEGAAADNNTDKRTGVYTSGIIATATKEKRAIALFFTGRRHAGENLEAVLSLRKKELEAPIQMCDALASNTTGEFKTILANCLAHARRGFVEVVDDFPKECRFVLEKLRDVYKNEGLTKQQCLSPKERLDFHQKNSSPIMTELRTWLEAQFKERLVEPNSELGKAITYMSNHWEKLTLFLRVESAPIDNNICERILKKAILHRKNSYFFKTLNGAHVGDIFMSLIHTAELANTNVFDYLVAALQNYEAVKESPTEWMPWNYQQALLRQRILA
jgi:hypothetical protein